MRKRTKRASKPSQKTASGTAAPDGTTALTNQEVDTAVGGIVVTNATDASSTDLFLKVTITSTAPVSGL